MKTGFCLYHFVPCCNLASSPFELHMQLLLPLTAVSLHRNIRREDTDLLCAVGFVILLILYNEILFYFHSSGAGCSYSNIYPFPVFPLILWNSWECSDRCVKMKRATYIFQDTLLESEMRRKFLVRVYVIFVFRISIVSIAKNTIWNLTSVKNWFNNISIFRTGISAAALSLSSLLSIPRKWSCRKCEHHDTSFLVQIFQLPLIALQIKSKLLQGPGPTYFCHTVHVNCPWPPFPSLFDVFFWTTGLCTHSLLFVKLPAALSLYTHTHAYILSLSLSIPLGPHSSELQFKCDFLKDLWFLLSGK